MKPVLKEFTSTKTTTTTTKMKQRKTTEVSLIAKIHTATQFICHNTRLSYYSTLVDMWFGV